MDAIRVRFTFDYVDPGSYLVHRLLSRWSEETGTHAVILWNPLELRTPSAPRIDPLGAEWSALTGAMRKIADEEGIPFEEPTLVPWTRKAHELAFHAREKGCFDRVHQALFVAHFVRGTDIGRVDRLVELGEREGLEPSETRTVLGVDRFLSEVEASRAQALGRGVRGVPTLEAGGSRLGGLTDAGELRSFLVEAGPEEER